MKLHPYLNFDGTCAEAFRFYEQLFGGKIEMMMNHADSPMAGQVPPEWADRIMHATLVFGEGAVLQASDAPPGQYVKPQGIYVSANIEKVSEGKRIFDALAENGAVTMGFEKTFWAPGFGMCVDRFGIPWMINCEQEG